MNVLLDTHAVIWFLTEDDQLPKNVKIFIQNRSNPCYVSIASLWEMAIKHSIGKLDLNTSLVNILDLITESGFEILPIKPQHLLALTDLPFHHRDPFDRLNIGQAFSEGFKVVSSDR